MCRPLVALAITSVAFGLGHTVQGRDVALATFGLGVFWARCTCAGAASSPRGEPRLFNSQSIAGPPARLSLAEVGSWARLDARPGGQPSRTAYGRRTSSSPELDHRGAAPQVRQPVARSSSRRRSAIRRSRATRATSAGVDPVALELGAVRVGVCRHLGVAGTPVDAKR